MRALLVLLVAAVPLLAGCGTPPEEAGPACVTRAFFSMQFTTLDAAAVTASLAAEGVAVEERGPGVPTTDGVPTEVFRLDFPSGWTQHEGGVYGQVYDHRAETQNRTIVNVVYGGSVDPIQTDQLDRQQAAVNATAERVREILTRDHGAAPEQEVADVRSVCAGAEDEPFVQPGTSPYGGTGEAPA